ncbi:MAG: twin-arginine translocase TatA/TatE family subunit [Dehalococcoidia bacterium]
MNFVGIGPQELIVILVVALIFVGPQRLPKLAADLARMIREIRRYTGGIAAEFNEAIKDFEKDTEPERTQWKEIGQGLGDATRAADEVAQGVQADAAGAPKPAESSANGASAQAPQNRAAPEPAPATEDRP